MAHVSISRSTNQSAATVWARLSDLRTHSTWMRDAGAVEFLTPSRSGPGTRMRVPTRVGPLRTTDIIEVTDWDEGRSITISHQGLIKGEGRFTVNGDQERSTITWDEDLAFPWWLGGPVTAWLARPVLRRIWAENLERFTTTL